MRHLLIIGAGGFGREAYAVARDAVGYGVDFDVKGFLDANAHALAPFGGYPAILGDPMTYVPEADDVFVTALGNIAARRAVAAAIEAKGGVFIPIVHRSAWLGTNVKVGAGAFISNNAVLTADIRVGRHVCIFQGTSIGHDAELGDFSHVYAQCALGGGVKVGAGACIYPGAVVVPRRTIGAGAVVGAGSTVVLNVPDGVTVFGSPAREVV